MIFKEKNKIPPKTAAFRKEVLLFFCLQFMQTCDFFTPKAADKNVGADIIRPFFIGNCLYLTPQIFDLVGGRYAVQTVPLLYKYNPISFGKPKETGLRPERKVFLSPAVCSRKRCPLSKGDQNAPPAGLWFLIAAVAARSRQRFSFYFFVPAIFSPAKKKEYFFMKYSQKTGFFIFLF